MSRALGAAFLNHQVEQLEKSVTNGVSGTGNWRDRRYPQANGGNHVGPNAAKRGTPPVGNKAAVGAGGGQKRGGEVQVMTRDRVVSKESYTDKRATRDVTSRRRSSDEERGDVGAKDADVVVVDASVLVHALYQIKKWCRDGREEVIIVPLEGDYCPLT